MSCAYLMMVYFCLAQLRRKWQDRPLATVTKTANLGKVMKGKKQNVIDK